MKSIVLLFVYLAYSFVRMLCTPIAIALVSAFRSRITVGDAILWRCDGITKAGVIEDCLYIGAVRVGVRFSSFNVKWVYRRNVWSDNKFNRFVLGCV